MLVDDSLRAFSHSTDELASYTGTEPKLDIIAPLADLNERRDSIRDYSRVSIREQVPEVTDKVFLFDQPLINHEELANAYRSCFSHVWICIF